MFTVVIIFGISYIFKFLFVYTFYSYVFFAILFNLSVYAFCCRWLSIQKGLDEPGKWFWNGFFMGAIALVILAFKIPNKEKEK